MSRLDWFRSIGFLFMLLVVPMLALSSDFTVTTMADTTDINPGDAVCADSSGMCSLRAAVQEANASVQVDDILLPAGTYVVDIPGANENVSATGDLDILNNLNIEGVDADLTIIESDTFDRVFEVLSGASVSICRVSIRNGIVDGSGGGIQNFGKLKIMSSKISNNISVGVGGGIGSFGSLSKLMILQSSVTANSALPESIVNSTEGGGIFNGQGELQINLSEINNNSVVGTGAGILNLGPMFIRNSTIANNQTLPIDEVTGGSGGGFFNNGTADIQTSTISGNTGHTGGGFSNIGSLALTNCTISGNHSPAVGVGTEGSGGMGGGFFNAGPGIVNLLNATIAENTAAFPSGGEGIHNVGYIAMKNTIVANDCSMLTSSQPITSQGYNIQIDNSCGLAAAGDLTANANLAALGDNGGPTQTHRLQLGSPAINTANQCPSVDQRLFVRPLLCDRGAYEKGFAADLAVVKNVDCDSVKVGNNLTFQLIATNFGQAPNEGVQLVDVLPSGLSFVGAETSQGNCDRPIPLRNGDFLLRCNLGTIDEDGTATVNIEVQAADSGVLINTGTLSSPTPEKQLINNVSTVRVLVRRLRRS